MGMGWNITRIQHLRFSRISLVSTASARWSSGSASGACSQLGSALTAGCRVTTVFRPAGGALLPPSLLPVQWFTVILVQKQKRPSSSDDVDGGVHAGRNVHQATGTPIPLCSCGFPCAGIRTLNGSGWCDGRVRPDQPRPPFLRVPSELGLHGTRLGISQWLVQAGLAPDILARVLRGAPV